MNYLSLNGISKVFEDFTEYDPNLMSFGFGQLYNQNGEPKVKQLYPGLWVNPTSMTGDGLYQINRSFQILIYDLKFDNDSGTNENKTISDCEEYGYRFIRFCRSKSEVFDVTTWSMTPFNDKFVDDVCGVIIDITLSFNGESSDCEDPDYNFSIKYNDLD